MRVGAIGILVLGLAAAGCRDLGIPEKDDTSAGGSGGLEGLQILKPDLATLGEPLPKLVVFRFSAAARNGVKTVKLSCTGRAPAGSAQAEVNLQLWESSGAGTPEAPLVLETRADLERCVPVDRAEQEQIEIAVEATDQTDLQIARFAQTVTVDFKVPTLTAFLPERIVAGQAFSFLLQSNVPLQFDPRVTVDGEEAQVEPFEAGNGIPTWRVLRSDPLQLGAARLPDGTSASTAVLEESNRLVSVQISGRSEFGNEARLDATLNVSRVAWERAVPGVLHDAGVQDVYSPPTDFPVASEHGITVPIKSGLGFTLDWLPGFFDQEDGAFQPTPAQFSQESWLGRGLDSSGGALLWQPRGEFAMLSFGGADAGTSVGTQNQPVEYGGRWCGHSVIATADCTPGADHLLQCVGLGADPSVPLASTSDTDRSINSGAYQFSSGEHFYSLLAPQLSTCGALEMPSYRMREGSIELIAGLQPEGTSLQRILPSPRGDFAVVLTRNDGSSGFATRWGLSGTSLEGQLGGVAPLVPATWGPPTGGTDATEAPLSYRPDHTLLMFPLMANSGITRLRAQGDNGVEAGVAQFFGYYEPLVSTVRSTYPLHVFTLMDGEASTLRFTSYALMHRNGRNSGYYSVLAIDEQMRPKWVFHYPRAVVGMSPYFVGSSEAKYVYLVDPTTHTITALAR